jgi:hypothetical protein
MGNRKMQFGQQVKAPDEGPQHVVKRRHPGVWSGHPKAFKPGQSGNPSGAAVYLERQNALMLAWCEGAGVDIETLTAAERTMLREAAKLALLRPSSKPNNRIRVANSIARILTTLGLVERRRKPRTRSEPEVKPLPHWAKRLEAHE